MAPAQSMVICHRGLHGFLEEHDGVPPATIAFEMPTGRHRNPSLVMHTA
jgi:hypothetical protein